MTGIVICFSRNLINNIMVQLARATGVCCFLWNSVYTGQLTCKRGRGLNCTTGCRSYDFSFTTLARSVPVNRGPVVIGLYWNIWVSTNKTADFSIAVLYILHMTYESLQHSQLVREIKKNNLKTTFSIIISGKH